MSFQPVLPLTGYAGWRFLGRTMERQRDSHDQSQQVQREVAYFAEKIGTVRTPEDLVSDYRLLKVALGAFGLGEAINGKALIRKVLNEGAADKGALANRLSDKRWLALAKAFDFGGASGAGTGTAGFADRIAGQYRTQSFEAAIGEVDANLGLALTLDREMATLASDDMSEEAKWFSVLGSTSLRAVFDGAFGLPREFAALDLDRQVEIYQDRTARMFGSGSASQFAAEDKRETLIKTFLIRADLGSMGPAPPGRIALTLLGG
ncbi:DUF1217 domain-containing protein [Rhodobacter sphaeroides]|uniref:DUF1217 domain-containing protein n=1 Tax=Cereibacter sphaeroides TaxID=1063 RepID=UPI00132B8FDA|nr:DUF1217 domain-containing protein [Cereibacter sphaeroides]MWP39249.1 DUF1217 domain-containing protein [Cereibacter sphaeroides]